MGKKASTEPAGAATYVPWFLSVYDFWVLFISGTFAWRCSTKTILLPFFRQNVSRRHLDVGVGTGYYLSHANLSRDTSVTLIDINTNSLATAAARYGRKDTKLLVHDALKPLHTAEKFESISMFYLLHCLPGPVHNKAVIFSNLKRNMTSEGVLFGATVLGGGIQHNLFGALLMKFYNWKGIFDNFGDDQKVFRDALERNFEEVEASVVGAVLIFRAKRPRTKN